MKRRNKKICFLLAALLLFPALVSCHPASNSVTADPAAAAETAETAETTEEIEEIKEDVPVNARNIDLEKLAQSGALSQRWMSVPFSRLIVNPYNFNSGTALTHSDYSDRPSMPLNLGYLDPYTDSGSGVWMDDLLTLYADVKAAEGAEPEYLYKADFSPDAKWIKSGGKFTEITCSGDTMAIKVLSQANEPWQFASQKVDLDLSTHPTLTITVDSCEANWSLKICENGKEDTVLIGDTSKTGTFTMDLASTLGREDTFQGTIKVFEIGYDKTVVLSRLDIMTLPGGKTDAVTYENIWTPSYLSFTAEYEDGTKIEGFDTFADEDTILRKITLQSGSMVRTAAALSGKVSVSDGTITVDCGRYAYSILADRAAEIRYYSDITMLKAGIGAVSDPAEAKFAEFLFASMQPGESVTLAVSLHSDAKKPAEIAKTAADALAVENAAEAARAKWSDYYVDFLNRIPLPSHYEITTVTPHGVTAEDMEQMYLISWVFLAQNSLPANPELDYNYPQICCGKPGMWAYGDPKSAYSASWESFFGIQLLGYIEPDTAWSALEGLISLVDADGMLGGESLPSEKAHSAWLLYDLTGDRDRLAGVYDGIGRYLDWRIENPRWIFLETNDVNSADADFVVSALIDLEYMVKIAEALGKSDDAASWQKKHDDFLQMYYKWCFDGEGSTYQYCNKITFARSRGNTIWITKGLLIDGIDKEHSDILYKRFQNEFNLDLPLGGFTVVKHPEEACAILGLVKYGKSRAAYSLAEIYARDICRIGMLAENYEINGNMPLGTGVRPAMFGCATMIDSVLLMNGYSYQQHAPIDFGTLTEGRTVILP